MAYAGPLPTPPQASTRVPPSLPARVWRFHLYQACTSFAFWIPFWALWSRSHVASDFQFTLVDTAFWVGMLLFQLPVGAIADRLGRRRSTIIAESLRCVGILGFGLATSFAGYVAANVVWALGAAFLIGTSAYLYETLLEVGHESEFPRYIGRNTTVQLLSNAAGSFVGGLIVTATSEIQWTLLLGAAMNVGAVAVAWSFREPAVPRTTEPTYTRQLAFGLRIVRRREGVALLIGVQVFLGITLYVMAIFRPIYLSFVGLSELEIASWFSGYLLLAALVAAFAGRFSNVLGEFGTLALLATLTAGPFLGIFVLGRSALGAILQMPIYIAWSLQGPLVTAFLNRRIEPGQRATVLSMGAFAYTLGLVVLEPIAGIVATASGLLVLGLFLGILALVPSAYILVRWRATVAPWPPITPVPTRLLPGGARVSRFFRVVERLTRLRP